MLGTAPSRQCSAGVLAFDPRQPALMEWLGSLDPQDELIVRLALSQLSEYCRADPFWARRIDILMARCCYSSQQLDRIRHGVDRAVAMVAGQQHGPTPWFPFRSR